MSLSTAVLDERYYLYSTTPYNPYIGGNEATAPGRKSSKERITFLACTNGDGTQKLQLLIIGKAKNPRAFKNKALPVEYVSSGNAWMTSAIFKDWFRNSFCKQVKSFLKSHRLPEKALLLIDNAPSHCSEKELISEDGKIFTLFLPPNCTALIQPMDQSSIRLTKLNYRKGLLAHILLQFEDGDDIGKCIKQINLMDAVCLLHNSWQKFTTTTLEKCWHKLLSGNLADYDPDDIIPLRQLQKKLQQAKHGYQDILNMLTQIDGEIHTNAEMNQWVENSENIIEDGDLEHEVIDDADETSDEAISSQKKASTLMH
ncbi:jerky protein homolog-like [Sitophilus oryzae]|uniref:Jerky protein homolog-like n=1 Tax=Sitophilus oryzae TaxID=7048 RepID=A0A6J2XTZ7_SITOR|nr:jerky protein homolog-like [Sitophilus oryzae]